MSCTSSSTASGPLKHVSSILFKGFDYDCLHT